MVAMVAAPARAKPSQLLTLSFPDERMRGVGYTLESDQTCSWTIEYYFTARRGKKDPGPTSWLRPDSSTAPGPTSASGFQEERRPDSPRPWTRHLPTLHSQRLPTRLYATDRHLTGPSDHEAGGLDGRRDCRLHKPEPGSAQRRLRGAVARTFSETSTRCRPYCSSSG